MNYIHLLRIQRTLNEKILVKLFLERDIIFSLKFDNKCNLTCISYLLCSPLFVPQIVGGVFGPVPGPVTVKVSVLKGFK